MLKRHTTGNDKSKSTLQSSGFPDIQMIATIAGDIINKSGDVGW